MNLLSFTIIYVSVTSFMPQISSAEVLTLVDFTNDLHQDLISNSESDVPSGIQQDPGYIDRRDMIPEEISEDSLEDDPGYDEGTEEDIYDTEELSSDPDDEEETSSVGEKREDIEMLDGFEGNREPLSFEDEIKEEEQYFGKIPESDDHNEKRSSIIPEEDDLESSEEDEEETQENDDDQVEENEDPDAIETENIEDDETESIDESDSDQNELDDQKRNIIADSDENILGFDSSETEMDPDSEEDSPSSSLESIPVEGAADTPDYDKLLTELEEDKEDGLFDTQKHSRDEVPKPEEIEEEVSMSQDLVEEEPESFDDLSNRDIDELITDFDDESDHTDNLECKDPNKRRFVIEYADAEDPSDDLKYENEEDHSDLIEDTPEMSFDCAECVNIDQDYDQEEGGVQSTLTCPAGNIKRDDVEKQTPNIIMSSFNHNKTRRSVMAEFIKKNDFVCNEKCKQYKRQTIAADSFSRLSQIPLWNKLSKDIVYHRIPRASFAILLDGNIHVNPLIRNLILNLMLLHSRDSMLTLGVFRECLKTVNMPGQVMLNSYTTYLHYIEALKKLSRESELGPAESRNIHYAVGDISKIVNEKAKEVDTELKIIVVITNGPFTNTGKEDINLKLIKAQNKRNNVKLYIIQLGSLYKACQHNLITYSSKVMIIHYVNQLVYGGRAKTPSYELAKTRESYTSIQGLIGLIRRKFRLDANRLVPSKGKITYLKGGIVGWLSDKLKMNFNRLDSTKNIISSKAAGLGFIDQFVKRDDINTKRQRIGRRKPSRVWNRRKAIRRKGRPSNRRIRKVRPGSRRPSNRRIRRVRPGSRRPGRPGGRMPKRPSATSRNVGLRFLRNNWRWSRYFPSLQRGQLGKTNLIILVDTMDRGLIDIMQKLLYYTTLQFPYTITKTSIFSLGTVKNVEICRKKAFARSEDIQRMVTSISETRGQTLTVAQRLLKVISPTSRLLSTDMNNVLILILSHRALDAPSFNYIANVVKATRIKLYIFGLGIEDQRVFFSRLSAPNRVFTSTTVRSFFTKTMFSRIIRQFKQDLGTSERVLNLDTLTRSRSASRSRPAGRASRPRTSRRMGRRPTPSLPGSRRKTRRPTPSRRKSGSRTTRKSRRRQSLWRRLASKFRRKGRDTIETPVFSHQNQNLLSLEPQDGAYLNEGFQSEDQSGVNVGENVFEATKPLNKGQDDSQETIDRSFIEVVEPYESKMEKRRRIPRLPSVIRKLLSADGSIGPGTFVFLVDGTFGRQMGKVRQFLKDLTLNFQRPGSYFSFATFGSTVRPHSRSIQFKSSTELISNIEKVKGMRSRFRNTGQALLDARRWLIGANPDYPLVVVVILNGRSTDDYRGPASMLMRDGVKVLAIVHGRNVHDREPLAIQSSSLLSFRTSFAPSRSVSNKLVPLFRSICGTKPTSKVVGLRNIVNNQIITKQWKWTVFGSKIRERKIAHTEIATILDMTVLPNRIVKLFFNVMNSFSVRSSHLITTIGINGHAAAKLGMFKRYIDQVSQQLILLSLIGRNTRRVIRRAGIRGTRIGKRDLIDDIFNEDSELEKRAIRGTRSIRRQASPLRAASQTTRSGPALRTSRYKSTAPVGTRLNSRVRPSRGRLSNSQNLIGSSNKLLSTRALLGGLGSPTTRKDYPVDGWVGTNNMLNGFGDGSSENDASNFDSSLYSQGRLSSPAKSRQSGGLSGLRSRGRAGSGLSRPYRPGSRGAGRNRKQRGSGRMGRFGGRRRMGGRRRIGRLRGRFGGSKKLSSRRRRVTCYRRTWRCLTLKLRRIGHIMRTRHRFSSYGPNKNKLVNIILSGWPKPLRRERVRTDRGFRYAARSITRLGVRLIIIVVQRRKTVDRFAQPILRATSSAFIHTTWSDAMAALFRFQTTSRRLFGKVEKNRFGLTYSRYNLKKNSQMSVLPAFGNILPPSTETYMTTKYLTTIQNLRRTRNWQQLVPGLRKNFLRESLSVIFVVDLSRRQTRSVIRRTIGHIIQMFDRRYARFTLVIMGRTHTVNVMDATLFNNVQMRYFLNRISRGITTTQPPRLGAALDAVTRRVLPKLRRTRRTLVILISQSKSADRVNSAAARLKNLGSVVSVIGIEHKISIPQLQSISSSGQLLITGHVSMLPVMLFRLQFALSIVINGPSRFSRIISMTASTKVRVYSTVMRGLMNDEAQRIVPLGRKRISYKRDEINNGTTTPMNSTLISVTPNPESKINETLRTSSSLIQTPLIQILPKDSTLAPKYTDATLAIS